LIFFGLIVCPSGAKVLFQEGVDLCSAGYQGLFIFFVFAALWLFNCWTVFLLVDVLLLKFHDAPLDPSNIH
jgi:hypothetical protein